MSGSLTGGVRARPGSKAGPPSLVQRDVFGSASVRPQSFDGGVRRRDADGRGARSELEELPLVVADRARVAERVSVVGRVAHDLVAADARGTTPALRRVGVRRVVGDVGDVVLVDLDAERVAEAHRVDLGTELRVEVRLRGDGREVGGRVFLQVAGRDGVRAGARARVGLVEVGGRHVVLDLDPEDLAAEVVGVGRRATIVAGHALVHAAVQRRDAQRAVVRGGHRGRRGRVGAGQAGAVDGHQRLVLAGQRATEEDVDVGRVGRAATRLDVVDADVRQRLDGGVDRRGVRVVGDRRGRLAVPRDRERAARGVGGADGLLLVGQLVLERAEAVGVDARGRRVVARDHPQVAGLVEVDVTGDVAALLAVVVDPQQLLLGVEVQVRTRRVLDELEARELEVAHVRIPRGRGRREVRHRRVRRDLVDDLARGQLDVGDPLRGVVEVHPLVGREVRVDGRAVEAVLRVRVHAQRVRQRGGAEVGDQRRGARLRIVQAHATAAVGLDQTAVGELIEADRLVEVRLLRDLDFLEVLQDGRAAVGRLGVALARGPRDRALQVLSCSCASKDAALVPRPV